MRRFCKRRIPYRPGLEFDYTGGLIWVDGWEIRLTDRGSDFVKVLYDAMPNYLPTGELVTRVYGGFDPPEHRVGWVYICHLRKVFRGTPLSIESIHTWGYRLRYNPDISTVLAMIRECRAPLQEAA